MLNAGLSTKEINCRTHLMIQKENVLLVNHQGNLPFITYFIHLLIFLFNL